MPKYLTWDGWLIELDEYIDPVEDEYGPTYDDPREMEN